jgi:KDO2-lipid IV(A) lauroyltransferase
MDTNMTPPQGEFVEFFGRLACTASGLARVALKTGRRWCRVSGVGG